MQEFLQMYVIMDTVAEEASPPFLANNDGVAFRNFTKAMEKVDKRLQPDYQLLHVGQFRPSSGEIESMIVHKVNPTTITE